MDTEVMSKYSRQELEQAHAHYVETANRCAAAGEWREWADLFKKRAHQFLVISLAECFLG